MCSYYLLHVSWHLLLTMPALVTGPETCVAALVLFGTFFAFSAVAIANHSKYADNGDYNTTCHADHHSTFEPQPLELRHQHTGKNPRGKSHTKKYTATHDKQGQTDPTKTSPHMESKRARTKMILTNMAQLTCTASALANGIMPRLSPPMYLLLITLLQLSLLTCTPARSCQLGHPSNPNCHLAAGSPTW